MACIARKTLVSFVTGAILLAAPGVSHASADVVAAPVSTTSAHGDGTITTPGHHTGGKWDWFQCAWSLLGKGLNVQQYADTVASACKGLAG